MLDVGPYHISEKRYLLLCIWNNLYFSNGSSTSKNPEYTAEVSPYMKYIWFFIVIILCVSNGK